MREFSKVSPLVWRSERFIDLPSDDGRYLYLYLLTCEHQNSAGAYRLPDAYACADLRWKPERYVKAKKELVSADLIAIDDKASVIAIRRWFQHNPPMSLPHLKGIQKMLDKLPSLAIASEAALEAEAAFEARAAKTPGPPKYTSPLTNTAYLSGKR
jgi:hypothetical protein